MAMGFIKKNDLIMKIIFVGLLSMLFCNCSEKNKEKIALNQIVRTSANTNSQMRKFNVTKYESNIKKDPSYEGYWKDKDIYVKQYHLIKDGYIEGNYTRSIVQNYVEIEIKNNKFRDVYTFENTGILKSIKHYFGNNLEVGKWIYYQNNNIVKTEDKDENYTFTLDQVLKYGEHKKVNFLKTGEISKSQSKDYGMYVWEISWNTGKINNDGESYLFRKVILNGNTGAELSSKEYYQNPLAR